MISQVIHGLQIHLAIMPRFDHLRGHVIAFKSSATKDIPAMFYPLPADKLPALINVVLIAPAKNLDDVHTHARKSPMLQVRGPVIVQWCRHLQEVYSRLFNRSEPHPQLSEEALAYYQSLGTAVPETLIAAAICTKALEESEQILGFHHKETDGYTNNPEPTPTDSVANLDTNATTFMQGIDHINHTTTGEDEEVETALITHLRRVASAHENINTLQGGGLIALTHGNELASDYDPMWAVLAHPSMFPNGTGAKPDGMSLETWVTHILRMHPRKQFQNNALFVLDMFDVLQRHNVNIKSACT